MTENAAFRLQLGNAGPCAPHIATMQDLPRLAWLTSLGLQKGQVVDPASSGPFFATRATLWDSHA